MSDDLLFQIDVKGDYKETNSYRPRYKTGANIEVDESVNKPSQERPAILKKKSKRYHQDVNSSKFKPGYMSEELRSALGLRKFDIPDYIYRMRQLGYPPGWLKKCEVVQESMSIIGANSSYKSNSAYPKYDCDKLHEYPGFNSYKNYHEKYDNSEIRGFWPMQENCLIKNFKLKLKSLQLVGKEATDLKDIRLSTSDDTMEFNLPENKRKRPMASSTPSKEKSIKTSDLSEGEIDSDHDESKHTSNENSIIEKNNSNVDDNSLESIPFNKSDVTNQGTLLLVNPVNKPHLDNFSSGIGDHRLFENLPNAKGSYSKVKAALKKNWVKNGKS